MRTNIQVLLTACFITTLATFAEAQEQVAKVPKQLGIGINYWRLNDRPGRYEKSGFSYYASYRSLPSFWGYEINLEYYPEDTVFTDSDAVWEPQAFVIIGTEFYGAAGVGWQFGESNLPNSPTYSFKAGYNFDFLSFLKMDINAQYKYHKLKDFDSGKKIDANSFGLGAAISYKF
jgi:hypothetical protein